MRAVSSHSLPVDLVIADDAPHALGEDLRAAAGQRIHARVLQPLQHFANRDLRAAARGSAISTIVKAFRCTCGKRCFRPRSISQIPVERQLRMQAADDVELGDRFASSPRPARCPDLVERHRVRLRIARLLAERAEPAAGHADVGRIDVAVDVEVRDVAVQPLAHDVGHVAERQDVGGAVQRHAVVEDSRSPRLDFVAGWASDGGSSMMTDCMVQALG